MKIIYNIKLLSDWHVGSGLDAGADADALVLKDENNLPYIPGKTIKGLLKDSLNEICEIEQETKSKVDKIFGWEEEDVNEKVFKTHSGLAYFSNAKLSENEQQEITKELSAHLYKNIASTRIGKNGLVVRGSLRTIQVCIPVSLKGSIETDVENADEILGKAMKWTRYLGVGRNRGLGRCKFSITEKS